MVIFRVDGNKKIGAGHVMRCLSVAEVMRERGQECLFVTAESLFASIIQEQGFKVEIMQSDYFDLYRERDIFVQILERYVPEYVVVDSYYVTKEYFNWLKKYGKIIYIDDRADFAYPVDVLVNYNIFANQIDYEGIYRVEGVNLPKLLIGAEYIPLRKEFQDAEERIQPEIVQKVLVSTGGADAEHVMLNFIKYLQSKVYTAADCEYHLILGAMNEDVKEISQMTKDMEGIVLHQNVKSMKALMTECDMAISAAGSTLYELCACGLPTITYTLADNQIPAEQAFAEQEIMMSAGDYRTVEDFYKTLFLQMEKVKKDYSLRIRMASNGYQAVNRNGASRLVEQILI